MVVYVKTGDDNSEWCSVQGRAGDDYNHNRPITIFNRLNCNRNHNRNHIFLNRVIIIRIVIEKKN